MSRELYESMRAHLTCCGLAAELQLVPGRGLSGGQRSRLALACVSFLRPHVLILDEPTNNLDVESVVRKSPRSIYCLILLGVLGTASVDIASSGVTSAFRLWLAGGTRGVCSHVQGCSCNCISRSVLRGSRGQRSVGRW